MVGWILCGVMALVVIVVLHAADRKIRDQLEWTISKLNSGRAEDRAKFMAELEEVTTDREKLRGQLEFSERSAAIYDRRVGQLEAQNASLQSKLDASEQRNAKLATRFKNIGDALGRAVNDIERLENDDDPAPNHND